MAMGEHKLKKTSGSNDDDWTGSLIRVDRMYESLRHNEYSMEPALGELIDNSIDAGASNIYLELKTEKIQKQGSRKPKETITEIALADDGCGMDANILERSLVLGESIRDKRRGGLGIGRFGVGMTLGSISLAKRVEVYSRVRGDTDFIYTYIDLEEIGDGKLIRIPVPVKKTPEKQYAQLLRDVSGTIVVLKKCDRANSSPENLANYIGRTYRKFIAAGIKIKMNGSEIFMHDPLYMAGPTVFDIEGLKAGEIDLKAVSWGTETIPLEIPDSDGKTANVTIKMSILPKEWRLERGSGGSADAKKRKIDQNEGISILRADREVLYGHVPYIIGKKGEAASLDIDRWWGCEISFPPELDSYFQVRYIKRGAEPIASLRDRIRDIIDPTIKSARKLIRADWAEQNSKKTKEAGAYGKAEKTMAQADSVFPKSRHNENLTEDEAEKLLDVLVKSIAGGSKTTQEHEKKKAELREKAYSIEQVDYPQNILFDTVHILGKIIIKLNVNHPFYKTALLPLLNPTENEPSDSCEKSGTKDAILLLLLAFAKAEAMFPGNEELFENFKVQWGTFLATVINTYN